MKQGTLLTRIVMIVLLVAIVAYMGFYVWQGIATPFQTVTSYAYEVDDGVALSGFVVRQEYAVSGETDLSQVLPAEGEKVQAGAAVAVVYGSESALQSRRTIQNLELRLEQLHYAMRRNDSVEDTSRLDGQLVTTLAKLKSGVSAGSLAELEEDGLALRSIVVKRTGDLTTTAASLAALQMAAADVEGQLTGLRATAGAQTRYITVRESGTFSGLADGYEDTLTPASLGDMTARELDELLSGPAVTPPRNAVGKLITDSTWYFVTAVNEETAKRLEEGDSYTLSFTGDFREEVRMKLTRLGEKEDGKRIAVFSCDRALEKVTLARLENATLVFHRYTGVRVPDQALRVLDNEDGTTTLGVYTLVGRRAEFKPAEIVREGEGFYLLRGTAQNRKVLRPGDVIVLSSQPLYDGKVVQ